MIGGTKTGTTNHPVLCPILTLISQARAQENLKLAVYGVLYFNVNAPYVCNFILSVGRRAKAGQRKPQQSSEGQRSLGRLCHLPNPARVDLNWFAKSHLDSKCSIRTK